MHSRTRRLLTAAALTLLAVGCAAAFGASNAAAASQKAPKVHKISSCGYTASSAGIYELTKNITDSGSGTCITLHASNVTLYLDGHTITGTGSDICIYSEGGSSVLSKQSIIGGTVKKPTKVATLTGCEYGLYVYWTAGTMASYLNIVSPTNDGVYEDYSSGMMLSHIGVPLHSNTADGFDLNYGANNTVTKSVVDNNSSDYGFFSEYEVGDSFTHDTVVDTYNSAGSSGYGFYDEYSSRNTFSHDSSKGQYTGFYLYEDGYGPVTATYNSATGPSTNSSSYGFFFEYDYQESDTASPYHTLVSHNKSTGFQYGFYDYTDTGDPVAEKWIDNTADNYSEYGYYMNYPTDFIMTGNTADANTSGKKYTGGTTYGFFLDYVYSSYAFAKFSGNQSYDNQWGFYNVYPNGYMVGGKGNIAKRNQYASYDVEVND